MGQERLFAQAREPCANTPPLRTVGRAEAPGDAKANVGTTLAATTGTGIIDKDPLKQRLNL